jgi:Protein of unknown function (DUF664)
MCDFLTARTARLPGDACCRLVCESHRAFWHAECERAREIVANAPSLDASGVRKRTGEPISLRRILVDMLAEYARHNGHADLLRERIDGATGFYDTSDDAGKRVTVLGPR